MAKWVWCVVVLALSCASVIATDGIPNTEKITVVPTSKPTTKIITSATPSTAPPTTPPATPSTTTPTTPPTTTPTTTPPAPTPPKPTPAPAPPQPPSTSVWNYTDGTTNITCIMVQFAVQFNITYATANGTRAAVVNLPKDSKVSSGGCGNTTQWIQLSWLPENATTQNQNNFTVKFELNSTTHNYHTSLLQLDLVYDASIFPDAASNASISLVSKKAEWYAGVSYSYRCKRAQTIVLTSLDSKALPTANVTISDVQEQAFRTEKGKQFGIATDCEVVDVPDVVPIAVGCALGGLVLVVLVAYMVGRRRSQARGYLSM